MTWMSRSKEDNAGLTPSRGNHDSDQGAASKLTLFTKLQSGTGRLGRTRVERPYHEIVPPAAVADSDRCSL
jgi:hypothetical protein